MNLLDVHTHNPEAHKAIINLDVAHPVIREGLFYSIGVHPWLTADEDTARRLLDTVELLASHPQVLAIGEIGLDKLRGGDMRLQDELLSRQIAIAERVRKPLILHVVKAYQEVMEKKRLQKSSVDWIIHGFRGKPELAQELLRHSFYLSLGEKYNESTAGIIPPSRLLIETDTSDIDIEKLAACHPQLDRGLADNVFKVR